MAETTSMDNPKPGVDKRLVIELMLVGGLLALSSYAARLPGYNRNDLTILFKLAEQGFSPTYQIKTTLMSISGMALWVILFMRMTWWNSTRIDFGLRKMPWRDLALWSSVVFVVLVVENIVYVMVTNTAQPFAIQLPHTPVDWSLFPVTLLSVLFTGLIPIPLVAYTQGLMGQLFKHSDIVPWLVALVHGATAMATFRPAAVVNSLVIGAVLAMSRFKSGYAWPAICGFVLAQLLFEFVRW